MITVLRLWGEDRSVQHFACLDDAFAVLCALATPHTCWHLVERGGSRRAFTYYSPARVGCELLNEATGHQLIQVHDTLTGSSLYEFTSRAVALERVHAALDELHPAPADLPRFPTLRVHVNTAVPTREMCVESARKG